MSFCSEDGRNISVWNTGFLHPSPYDVTNHTATMREHRSFVLVYFSCLLYIWDGPRKFVTSHIVKLYFICSYTLYMYIYIYTYIYISVKERKGWRVPAVRKCAWVSGYLLNCFPAAFPVISLLSSSSLHLRMFLAVLSLCWRVVFMMLYGERGLLS